MTYKIGLYKSEIQRCDFFLVDNIKTKDQLHWRVSIAPRMTETPIMLILALCSLLVVLTLPSRNEEVVLVLAVLSLNLSRHLGFSLVMQYISVQAN